MYSIIFFYIYINFSVPFLVDRYSYTIDIKLKMPFYRKYLNINLNTMLTVKIYYIYR